MPLFDSHQGGRIPLFQHDPKPADITEDERLMAAALAFSRRGLGLAAPNPSVGALVVKDGVIVGRGVTSHGGRPHAETQALAQAGDQARGATLYVTLEPCSHHGHTPPCADAIIAAGIKRVVSALEDANPLIAGRGHQRLRSAGIELSVGVGEDAARRLHLGHNLVVTAGRPMVSLKLAETADGFAANLPGAPRLLITGGPANDFVHMERAIHDAVLIGSGTAQADDPLLTVRLPGMERRKPLRVILDSQARLSPSSRLAETAANVPTLLLVGESAATTAVETLRAEKIDVAMIACGSDGHIDLKAALQELAKRGITRVICEGGPHLAAALVRTGFADEVILLRSQTSLGCEGLPALDASARERLSQSGLYAYAETRALGEDQLIRYERKL